MRLGPHDDFALRNWAAVVAAQLLLGSLSRRERDRSGIRSNVELGE